MPQRLSFSELKEKIAREQAYKAYIEASYMKEEIPIYSRDRRYLNFCSDALNFTEWISCYVVDDFGNAVCIGLDEPF